MSKPKPKSKFWNNGWTIAFGAVIFSFILSILKDFRYKEPFLTTVKKIFSSIYQIITTILTFKINVGMILLTIFILIGVLFLIDKIFYSKVTEPIKDPNFLSYKQDILKRWLWTWDYKQGSNGYVIINVKPLCIKDETPLVNNDKYGLICPRCETRYGDSWYGGDYSNFEDINAITILIEDNIKKRFNNQ